MDKLARIHTLRLRMDALVAESLPPSSGLLLEEGALHVDAAFHNRLNPSLETEYNWACGDSFVSFVEGQQALRATMAAEAERVWLAEKLRCLECGCSRFDAHGVGCAVCGKSHGPRWERCYISAETQRTLWAQADDLKQFGVTLTEDRPLQKEFGTTVSVIGLVLAIADSLDDGVLGKLILRLHELGISRNEILRLRLAEPEEVGRIISEKN